MKFHVVLVALAAFAFSGCFSARQATAPSRDTPSGTVEMFKLYARKGDPAGEWDVLSPGLKQRISQQAGRKVDALVRGQLLGQPLVSLINHGSFLHGRQAPRA